MPYEHTNKKNGNHYVLYTRAVELKGGRKQVIYFFTKKGNKPKSGKPRRRIDQHCVGCKKQRRQAIAVARLHEL